MFSQKQKLDFKKGFTGFCSSALAILAGLLLGLILLFVANPPQAIPGFLKILEGGFGSDWQGIGKVINYAIPIILTGLSVGFAFKTGLFNIGASGQFMVGGFLAVLVGVRCSFLPPLLHWLVAVLAAVLGGAVWGALVGILKAYRNVNEVITSIMLNYVGLYFVNWIVPMTVYDRMRNQTKPVLAGAKTPTLGLDQLFPKSNLDISLFISLILVVVLYIVINKTTFGYELRACGLNREAAYYAGINEKRSIMLSMVIAGALAGLGGGLLYLGHTGTFIQIKEVIAPQGFNGIPVALLGLSNPIGIFFSGIFIAHITVGGTNLQLFEFTVEIIDMIIAAIIYFGAFALLFRQLIGKAISRRSARQSFVPAAAPADGVRVLPNRPAQEAEAQQSSESAAKAALCEEDAQTVHAEEAAKKETK